MGKLATITRRAFLIGSAAVVGGVAFGVHKVRQAPSNPLLDDLRQGATALTPYVRIDGLGVTLITPRAEMGQGIHTTLAALLAEELDVAWDSIRVEHGAPGAAYYNRALVEGNVPFAELDHGVAAEAMRGAMGVMARLMPMQITGGSSSVADLFERMRVAGAAARYALVAAAARKLGLPAARLKTDNGSVLAPDGRRLTYLELAPAAAGIDLPASPPLKPREQWRYLGKSMPRVDMVAKCTGTATFGIDVRLPGMVFATVRMNPAMGAPLVRYDASVAKAMRGVLKVIDLPGGVAVIANNTWRAFQAAQAVQCEWAEPGYPASTTAMMEAIVASMTGKSRDNQLRNDGNVEQALAGGTVLEAEYRVPFLAHATMEPMNAVAWLHDGKLEIWAGVQNPTAARDLSAKAAGLGVILCVGESLDVRDAGNAEAVVSAQLLASLPDGAAADWLAIAYEPIWAIGTGRNPTMEAVATMHAALRAALASRIGEDAQGMRILYGGSMNGDNAAELIAIADVDGGLVGGASLTAEKFAPIITAADGVVD